MKKYLYIAVVIVIIIVAGFTLYSEEKKDKQNIILNGCDQSATTTDCSKITQINPVPTPEPESNEIEWREYKNNELGISFSYPSKKSVNQDWGIGRGDTGRSFQATIELESRARIFGYAFTSDYSVPKGGPAVGPEGYIVKDGKYYVRTRGKAASVSFVPDEIWKLSNGSEALVIYGKNFDAHADYPDAPLKALINLPGPEFTGIGFVIFNSDGSGMEGPWTRPIPQEDLEIFKKIIMSMKFLR